MILRNTSGPQDPSGSFSLKITVLNAFRRLFV